MPPLLRVALAWCWLGCLLTLAGPAAASSGLWLDLSCHSQPRPGGGRELRLTVSNRGGEAVSGLQAVPLHPPGAEASSFIDKLDPRQSANLDLSWPAGTSAPSHGCEVLRLDLRDQRQRLLSALGRACQQPTAGEAPALEVSAPPQELAGQGRLRARLRNRGMEPLPLTLRLFTPRELAASPASRELTLAPGQEAEVLWDLENQSGQIEGSYPLLLLSSLERDGRRQERVDEALVSLVPLPNPFRKHLYWWLAALAGLAVWLGVAQWRRLRP